MSGRLRSAVGALLLLLRWVPGCRARRAPVLSGLKSRVLRRVGHLPASERARRGGRILSRSRSVAIPALRGAFSEPRLRSFGKPGRSVVRVPALSLTVIPLRRGQLAEPALSRPGLIRRAIVARTGTEPRDFLAGLRRHLWPG